jgi:hypothetical protein
VGCSVGFFKRRGARATGSGEEANRVEAAILDAAHEAAEIAQSASVLAEGIRFHLDAGGARIEGEEAPDHPVRRLAYSLADAAAELHRGATRLSRALADEPLAPLDVRTGQAPALRRFSPPNTVQARRAHPDSEGDDVSDGLRVIVLKMLSDGWSRDEAAYYLWSELGIGNSRAVVATVVDDASTLSDEAGVA